MLGQFKLLIFIFCACTATAEASPQTAFTLSPRQLAAQMKTLTVKSAHSLAQFFYPKEYTTEIPEWQSLAQACQNTTTVHKKAKWARSQLDSGTSLKTSQASMQIREYSMQNVELYQALISEQNLRSNLLRKFDVHYARIKHNIILEKKLAENMFEKWSVARAEAYATQYGKLVRTAIQQENYVKCSSTINQLLAAQQAKR